MAVQAVGSVNTLRRILSTVVEPNSSHNSPSDVYSAEHNSTNLRDAIYGAATECNSLRLFAAQGAVHDIIALIKNAITAIFARAGSTTSKANREESEANVNIAARTSADLRTKRAAARRAFADEFLQQLNIKLPDWQNAVGQMYFTFVIGGCRVKVLLFRPVTDAAARPSNNKLDTVQLTISEDDGNSNNQKYKYTLSKEQYLQLVGMNSQPPKVAGAGVAHSSVANLSSVDKLLSPVATPRSNKRDPASTVFQTPAKQARVQYDEATKLNIFIGRIARRILHSLQHVTANNKLPIAIQRIDMGVVITITIKEDGTVWCTRQSVMNGTVSTAQIYTISSDESLEQFITELERIGSYIAKHPLHVTPVRAHQLTKGTALQDRCLAANIRNAIEVAFNHDSGGKATPTTTSAPATTPPPGRKPLGGRPVNAEGNNKPTASAVPNGGVTTHAYATLTASLR